MNIINKLTLRHLHLNRGRTLITILGIMLSVAMICAVAGFALSLRGLLIQQIKENKGDYHVVYVDVTAETVELITGEDIFSSYYTKDGDTKGLINIYLRLKDPDRNILELAGSIAGKLNIENWGINNELLALEGVIAMDNVMHSSVTVAAIVILIIIIGSVIVIANAFYISASERVRQFGLLKSAGATSGQIGRSILFEAFILAIAAIPPGILLGFLIQVTVLWITNNLLTELNALNNNTIEFHAVFNPIIILFSAVIALLTVLISAWLPARRAAKTSPIDSIRRTGDIKIRSKQLKTSKLIQKLFGFEGTLAAKSLKRNRGKYRATVISLTVSIVLFVSMSSLAWIMNTSANMGYGGMDFDVLISVRGDIEYQIEADSILENIPSSETNSFRYLLASAEAPVNFFTERELIRYRKAHDSERPYETSVAFIPILDDEFAKISKVADDKVNGILINTTGPMRDSSKLMEFTPYNYKKGTELQITSKGAEQVITLSAEITELPDFIPSALYINESVNIILPETVFMKIAHDMRDNESIFTFYTVKTADPDAYCEEANNAFSRDNRVSVNNVIQLTRLNRNIALVVMLFGYGFISMLSLIAVTSVVTTISTGMALRKQEFAMLYSVGTTSEGMNKMLNLESLMYSLKSLIIGLPIGIVLSYLLYLAMTNTVEFAFRLPWSAIAISTAAVMLLSFGTMRYSKGKLKRISIVEAIRNETV